MFEVRVEGTLPEILESSDQSTRRKPRVSCDPNREQIKEVVHT